MDINSFLCGMFKIFFLMWGESLRHHCRIYLTTSNPPGGWLPISLPRAQSISCTISSDGPGMGSHRQEKVSETEAAGWFYRHTHLGINHT